MQMEFAMPRRPRSYLPGFPVHVVHRGNNREATFFSDEDYQFYLEALQTGLRRYAAHLHAYVLMTNHVHLLLTPEHENSIPRILQHIGRMYVRHINKTYRRSGTLWEGRHKSSLVDAEHYLLKCYRYIELNPVVAGMVKHPGDYRWSSYSHNAQGDRCPFISEHVLYQSLHENPERRFFYYRELFRHRIDVEDIHAIRTSLRCNYPLGNSRFREQIEHQLKRSLGHMDVGRPRQAKTVHK